MASKISVVVPSYNEEKNVSLVSAEISRVFSEKLPKYDYELIFVNDGSLDGTWEEIGKLAKTDKKVAGINLSKNFGHASALQAGLEKATGDAVISIDADLQHPPSLIPKLVEKWENGYEIVATIRRDTEGVGIVKKMTSAIFYKFLNSMSSLKIREGEADFRLIDSKALKVINDLPEGPKFYRGLVNWVGFKKVDIEYVAASRKFGRSSYTLKKMFELARMGLTSFSLRPLKLILAGGILITFLAAALLIAALVVKLFINSAYVGNLAIITLLILLMMGFLVTIQGVLAIYLIDIFNASKGRPAYIVRESVNIS